MSGHKKPKLTYREVAKAISNRTGLPEGMTKAFINAYGDITKEALLAQVEVPFADVCVFSWKQINPRENVATYNYFTHEKNEPSNVDGFQKTTVKMNKHWAKELKELTSFGVGEENPALSGKLRRLNSSVDETDEEENEYAELQDDDDDE